MHKLYFILLTLGALSFLNIVIKQLFGMIKS